MARRIVAADQKCGGDEDPKQAAINAAEPYFAANDSAFLAQDFHHSLSIPCLYVEMRSASPEHFFARSTAREENKGFVAVQHVPSIEVRNTGARLCSKSRRYRCSEELRALSALTVGQYPGVGLRWRVSECLLPTCFREQR